MARTAVKVPLLLPAALALALAAWAAGCADGAASEPEPPKNGATAPVEAEPLPPARLRAVPPLREVAAEGVRLSIPGDWAVTATPADPAPAFVAALERVRAAAPDALGLIEDSLGRPSPQRLVAFDPRLDGSYLTRLRLGVVPTEPGFEGDFSEWSARWHELTESTPTLIGAVESARVELPAGEALRVTYRHRSYEEVPLVADDYYLVQGGRAYVLSFEGGDDGLLPLFRAIAETLRIEP